MTVLVLSPYTEPLLRTIGEDCRTIGQERLDGVPECDWIISYGYRYILKGPILEKYAGRIINLHISLLPWNRGSDPNFWSWIEGTPKGVTIHVIDEGVDTGPILAQREVDLDPNGTLESTYEALRRDVEDLFHATWPKIISGEIEPIPQQGEGTFRYARERREVWHHFPKGWQTPVSEVTADKLEG